MNGVFSAAICAIAGSMTERIISSDCSRGKDAAVAVGAHASCVWAFVVVTSRLVVLRRLQGERVLAIAQDDEADFFALQELLDDEPVPEQCRKRRLCFFSRLRDHHTFSRSQTISLQNHREAEIGDRLCEHPGRS